MIRRTLVLLALSPLVACDAHAPKASATAPKPSASLAESSAESDAGGARSTRAPVVVAIVVDQLSAWVAEERLPLLPKDGAFARLVREGTWVKHLRLPYAATDTAPGHASLHTGKVPAESGIWGNDLPDPTTAGRVTFLREAGIKLVAPDGVRDAPSSSAARLRVDTVADRLRAARPDALVVSVSLKDRGAIMPAGKKPSYALWFDAAAGSFVTSTAFASTFPAWAKPIAAANAAERARGITWNVSDRAWLERNVGFPDGAPGEGDLDGLGTTFPHVAKTTPAFRATPASDPVILDLALAAVAAEHDPTKPTLVLVSMSSSDVIGHVFGPDSWEAWDHLYKLDAALGLFFRRLEERVGEFAVVLSADHGNSSMPEVVRARRPATCDDRKPAPPDAYDRSPCAPRVRVNQSLVQRELKAEITKAGGSAAWLFGVADPYVFLTPEARALEPSKRAQLDAAVRRVFERHKDALELLDVRDLETRCPKVLATARGIPERARAGEDTLTLVCRSWSPTHGAGDYYMVPKLGAFFDSEIVVGKGAGHGGPFLHDRTVPLLALAKGHVDPQRVVDEPVDFTAYAALLGSFLGLDDASPQTILSRRTATPRVELPGGR